MFTDPKCLAVGSAMPFELTPVICEIPIPDATSSIPELCITNNDDDAKKDSCMQSASRAVDIGTEPATDSDDDVCHDDMCPTVCTHEQFAKWKANRPWLCAKRLDSKDVGVSCTACSEVGTVSKCMSLDTSRERLSISNEWLCGITARNSKKLLDKVAQHASSKVHNMCITEIKNRAKSAIQKTVHKAGQIWREQNAKRIEETCKVFRTAYLIAWKHLSFRTHPYMFNLQLQNGVELGKMLFSHQSCSNIVKFIAAEMRQRLLDFILQSDCLFSLLMDESTTMANETALVVYLRAPNPEGDACNAFVTLCELTGGTSGKAIADTLLQQLDQMGLTKEVLQARLLGFCTDGASNLHGSVKGALKLISDIIERKDLVLFHCMNHKLELAVHAAVSTVSMVSHLRIFMDSLYAYYSRSPEHCRKLTAVSEALDCDMKKIGKIFDVRWLSSSYRTVDAVYTSLPALVQQLQEAAKSAVTSKDRATADGMAKKMQRWTFLVELALMRDILDALKTLSLFLQCRSASVIDAKERFDCTMRILAAMKTVDGVTLSEVKRQIDTHGSWNGMTYTAAKSHEVESFTKTRLQFIQCLLDNLSARFPDRQLLESGAVLNPASWPEDEVQRTLYGDKEVIHLSNLCHMDSRAVVDEFRRYKFNQRCPGDSLSALIQAVRLLPISSADCERGFSCMNLNDTSVRNQLSIDTLSALLFIKVNGPLPDSFSPTPYVEKWIQTGRHASSDAPTGKKADKKKNCSMWINLF